MKHLQQVVWSEGLFVTPNHFQTSERSIEQQIQFRASLSSFPNWGFTQLRVDPGNLQTGNFELSVAAGIFPDGLAFSIPDDVDELPKGRDIKKFLPVQTSSVDVWLAVPSARAGVNIVMSDHNDAQDVRYISKTIQVRDEVLYPEPEINQEHKPVQLARRNFRLLFSGESLDGFTHLRIGRVIRAGDGYALDQSCLHPCLNIGAHPNLLGLIRERVGKLTSRSRALASRRQPGLGVAGFANLEDLLRLQTINVHLAGLKQLASLSRVHPASVYIALLQLAGELCAYSSVPGPEQKPLDPAQLPPYDHDNPGTCFTELDTWIEKLLAPGTEKCFEVALQRQGLFWVGEPREQSYFSNGQFYLAVKADMPVPDLIRATLRTKIASREGIEGIFRSAVNGVSLQHQTSLPPTCSIAPDFQYFRLNQSGSFWDDIGETHTIGIYVDPAVKRPELQLFVALE